MNMKKLGAFFLAFVVGWMTMFPVSLSSLAEENAMTEETPSSYGSVKIILTSSLTAGAFLEGGEFVLEEQGVPLLSRLLTDKKGEIILDNLPIGSYELKQVLAPDGYILSDTTFTVSIQEGVNADYLIENSPLADLTDVSTQADDQDSEESNELENSLKPENSATPESTTEPENTEETENSLVPEDTGGAENTLEPETTEEVENTLVEETQVPENSEEVTGSGEDVHLDPLALFANEGDEVIDTYGELVEAIDIASSTETTTILIAGNFAIEAGIHIDKNLVFEAADPSAPITLSSIADRHFYTTGNVALTFNNVVLEGNGSGGGIAVGQGAAGEATITGAQVSNVSAKAAIDVVTAGSALILNNANLSENPGGAINIEGNAAAVVNGSAIQNNQGNAPVYVKSNGSLTVNGSSISSNTGKNSGAIYAGAGAAVAINNSTFDNNQSSGYNGGAIYVGSGAVLTVTQGTFTNNKTITGYYGGAVYLEKSTGTISGSTFSGNMASFGGGAIYISGGASADVKNTVFDLNSTETLGGAVYADKGAGLTSANNTYSNNKSEWGGAVYVAENNTFTDTGSSFTKNNAVHSSGAIDVREGAQIFLTNSSFEQNVSDAGGAICGYPNAAITITNGNFTSNRADLLNVNGDGGAIHVHDNVVLTIKDTNFEKNTAYYNGGAISTLNRAIINITGGSFKSNTSTTLKGGAVYVQIQTTLNLNNVTFENNQAVQGGAVYAYSENVFEDKNSTYTGNTASNAGGALFFYHDERYVTNSSAPAITDSTFTNNQSANGGAVYLAKKIAATFTDATFNTNSTTECGGAIFGADGSMVNVTNGNFTGNQSESDGGAIYMEGGSSVLTIDDSQFNQNSTTGNRAFGGAIYAGTNFLNTNNGLIIDNTTFVGNTTGSRSFGGAILSDTNTKLADVTFTGNTATDSGGALYMRGAILTADRIIVKQNSAPGTGGITIIPGSAVINDSLFDSNTEGALRVNNVAKQTNPKYTHTATIHNTVFSNNTGYDGAGIYFMETGFEINGSTFTNNQAKRWGGAVVVYGDEDEGYDYTGTITNTSFTGNTADKANTQSKGGSIYINTAPVVLKGATTVKNSSGYNGGGIYITDAALLTVEDVVELSQNTATLDGGAIYTEELANVTVSSPQVVFENNKAATAHQIKEEDKALHSQKIKTSNYTVLNDEDESVIGFDYAYNNYDINYANTYPIKVVKKDSVSGKVLVGVVFELRKADTTVVAQVTTNELGEADFTVDSLGNYQLVEKTGLSGYVPNNTPMAITIGTATVVPVVKEVENVPFGSLTVIKVDAQDENITLQGVEFTLTHGDTVMHTGLTTDENGKFTIADLAPGQYELTETKVPGGYEELAGSITVMIEAGKNTNQKVTNQKKVELTPTPEPTSTPEPTPSSTLIPTTEPTATPTQQPLGKVVVRVVDEEEEPAIVLPGTKFNVYKDGVLLTNLGDSGTFTADGNGQFAIDQLEAGRYEIRQTYALPNYILPETSYYFVITAGNETAVTITNRKAPVDGTLLIKKVDAGNKTTFLPGAVFNLYRNGILVREGIVTNEKGQALINDLPYGTYELIETKAPKGYSRTASSKIIYVEPYKTTEIIITNKMLSGVPGTGDDGKAVVYLAVMIIALTCIIIAGASIKKKKKSIT